MLTKEDYCDYDTCVALKELGYKVPTSAYYMPHHKDLIWVSNPFRGGYVTDCFYSHNSLPKDVMTANFIDAPTLWEAQKWLREEKNIGIFVSGFKNGYTFWVNNLLSGDTLYQGFYDNNTCEKYKSYEEALSESIKEAVKILAIC
jgi:hypothetical protein